MRLGYIGKDINELFQPRHVDHLGVDRISSGSWIVYGTELYMEFLTDTQLPRNYRQERKQVKSNRPNKRRRYAKSTLQPHTPRL